MKRGSRIILIGISCFLVGVAGGLCIVACDRNEKADEQIEQVDEFIAKYEQETTYRNEKAKINRENDTKSIETEKEIAKGGKENASDNINTFSKSNIESNNGDYFVATGGVEEVEELRTDLASTSQVMTPEEFQVAGIIDWNGWRYTYYSEQVLAGEGLNIPDRWSDGQFVRDGNGYLCVASNEHEYGSIVPTPFGDAIVYDTIGDGVTGIIDIYVSFN